MLTAARISGSRSATRGAASRSPSRVIAVPYTAPTGSSTQLHIAPSPVTFSQVVTAMTGAHSRAAATIPPTMEIQASPV